MGSGARFWRVADFTLEEIKTLDAGSWFSQEFAGTRVPTFQEAIDLVKGQAGMYPETKAPEEYEALGLSMEEELARVLAANALDTPAGQTETPIYVQSFSPASLKRMYALTGDTYELVQLVGSEQAATLLTDDGLLGGRRVCRWHWSQCPADRGRLVAGGRRARARAGDPSLHGAGQPAARRLLRCGGLHAPSLRRPRRHRCVHRQSGPVPALIGQCPVGTERRLERPQ